MKTFTPTGRMLRAARTLAGLSQAELARAAGVALATVGHYERHDGVEVQGSVASRSKVFAGPGSLQGEVTADGVVLASRSDIAQQPMDNRQSGIRHEGRSPKFGR